VSGASDTLDPIAAAEAGIAGSKHLIASVTNDLSQQERWLAHYRVAERRRARRVKVRDLIYWLELRRQRLMRWLRRAALIALRLARTAAAFLSRTAIVLFAMLCDAATACFVWLRPRIYALALTLAAWTIAFWAWAVIEARIVARALQRAASISFAWLAVQSRALAIALENWLSAAWSGTRLKAGVLARATIKGASIAAAWSVTQARALALSLRRELGQLASSTRKKTGHFSRASLATASLGFSWAKQAERHPPGANHRALAIRRCTALISLEPRRARLPTVSGLDAPQPVSSRAYRASP
jgi:hypothetical protein